MADRDLTTQDDSQCLDELYGVVMRLVPSAQCSGRALGEHAGVNPIVRGEPPMPEHAASVFRYLEDPALYTYLPSRRPQSVEALQREFRRLAAGSRDSGQVWLNWLAVHADHPVGTLQATLFPDGSAIVAYVIFREYQGRGLGREGARWVLHELFERRSVRRVLAHVDQRNVASIRVALAIGMRAARGVETEEADPGDIVLSISADDWTSRRNRA